MIINLPATVEMASGPTSYADQIEWCHRNFKYRDFDDPLAASAQMTAAPAVAGGGARLHGPAADRIEGCLFGQRRGAPANVDLVTLGLKHVHPGGRSGGRLLQHQRDSPDGRVLQPAAGAPHAIPTAAISVFTALLRDRTRTRSNKGFKALQTQKQQDLGGSLPADSTRPDLGRSYEAIIRNQ